MRVIEKTEATAPLAEYTRGVKKEPVIITRKGKPIAALVSIENADLETVSLSTNREFLKLIERSRARQRAEGGISSDEMRRRLGVKKAGRA
ncbi:MAG: type II toxin-antitoxin system prevent-host-death family antitoxin [Deltaproteobacteria bacterium]|nr:type II toxin-antitoxin system prevent-host-death family antitoxin [Deltaproteobacteria bacterium]